MAGTYRWTVSYTGDQNSTPVSSACGSEQLTVTPARPALSATASASVPLGRRVDDTATLTGAARPTGQITFQLYGPNDPTCTATPAFTATATVTKDGSYTSGLFTATSRGTYQWTTGYGGDANNAAVSTSCGASGQHV
jgi:hypothetical protein